MTRAYTTACGRELGDQLRRNRVRAGISAATMARMLGWDPSKVSRIEHGGHAISEPEAIHYLSRCGLLFEEMGHMLDLARKIEQDCGLWISPYSRIPDSLRSLIYHESTATSSTSYEHEVVPGLLQTADYTDALLLRNGHKSANHRRFAVQARVQRQAILHVPDAAGYRFFIHERVLTTQVGDDRVMSEQMIKLLILASQPNITIRLIPEQAALGGSFLLLHFARHDPVMFLDSIRFGLFVEDKDYVAPYRDLVETLAGVALDAGQSRDRLVCTASRYDRAKGSADAANDVAQE